MTLYRFCTHTVCENIVLGACEIGACTKAMFFVICLYAFELFLYIYEGHLSVWTNFGNDVRSALTHRLPRIPKSHERFCLKPSRSQVGESQFGLNIFRNPSAWHPNVTSTFHLQPPWTPHPLRLPTLCPSLLPPLPIILDPAFKPPHHTTSHSDWHVFSYAPIEHVILEQKTYEIKGRNLWMKYILGGIFLNLGRMDKNESAHRLFHFSFWGEKEKFKATFDRLFSEPNPWHAFSIFPIFCFYLGCFPKE